MPITRYFCSSHLHRWCISVQAEHWAEDVSDSGGCRFGDCAYSLDRGVFFIGEGLCSIIKSHRNDEKLELDRVGIKPYMNF
jgi:hypothetical protein